MEGNRLSADAGEGILTLQRTEILRPRKSVYEDSIPKDRI